MKRILFIGITLYFVSLAFATLALLSFGELGSPLWDGYASFIVACIDTPIIFAIIYKNHGYHKIFSKRDV